jgi:uncharacterized protein YggE
MHRIFFAAALVAATAAASAASAQTTPPPREITVNGEGAASAAPDIATISIGVESVAAAAADALAENNRQTAAVIEAVKAAGADPKDIQTSNFSVSPRYDERSFQTGSATITGYQVTNQVTVRLTDVAGMGKLLDTVVKVGANRINGISFGFADPVKVADEARRQAVADAIRKAGLYAAAAGITLGEIRSIAEAQPFGGPRPMAAMRMAEAAAPIEAGEQTIEASVAVTWRIAD